MTHPLPREPHRPIDAEDEQSAYVRALCAHHAADLVVMACVLLDDIDRASETVAATLAAACEVEHPTAPADQATRTLLARSVYHRCLGQLATQERFLQPPATQGRPARRTMPFSHLPADQRALMVLAVFGRHDIAELARTLRLPTAVVVGRLAKVLPRIDIASAGRST